MSKKTIVILSGGMDSTVLVYHLLAEKRDLKVLSFDYGQRHKKELEYAAKTAQILSLEHQIIDLSTLRPLLKGSSQTDDSVSVPHGHYSADSMSATVVPNRNSIMMNVAAAWAISSKYDSIAFAAHKGDFAQYADCRPEFAAALDECIRLSDYHQVSVERPFIYYSKAQIAKIGVQLSVPFENTYSCYQGGDIHCGRCGTDVERLEALEAAGADDKTIYADKEYYKKVLAEVK